MERIGVGLIGTGFMGKCHAMAYGAVRAVYGDVPVIDRVALCDVEAGHAAKSASAWGFARSTTDCRSFCAMQPPTAICIPACACLTGARWPRLP